MSLQVENKGIERAENFSVEAVLFNKLAQQPIIFPDAGFEGPNSETKIATKTENEKTIYNQSVDINNKKNNKFFENKYSENTNKNSNEKKIVDPVKILVNRTRSKSIDYVIKGRLINDPRLQNSPLRSSYLKSTICNSTLTQEDGKITAHYCKSRWCSLCNRIRTGILINKYEGLIKSWEDKYFLSLTLRNPRAEDLASTLDEMIKFFGNCAMSLKQTLKMELQAFRKIEITYNVKEDTYHPHFHVIVKGKDQAEALRDYWLKKVNRKGDRAVEYAQNITKCDDDTVKELFKYFTKLLTDQKVYPHALDVVFQAMYGRRTFQSYLPRDVQQLLKEKHDEEDINFDKSTSAFRRLDEKIYWDYVPQARNYMDEKTGEFLTTYKPTETFERLLRKLEGTIEGEIGKEEALHVPR